MLSLLKRVSKDCEAREYDIANRIVRCFDGLDLTVQTFTIQGNSGFASDRVVKTTSGETKFYSAGEIDKALAKINELVDELKRGKPIERNTPPELKQ